MRSIYNIYEGILGNVDDVLASGEDAIAQEANIDTLPTVKDFTKGVFNRKWHQANWYCPNVIKRYRSKYPNFIPDTVDSISVILDAEYGRVVDCNLYFSTRGYAKLKSIAGWSEGFVGANLRKYKQMAIDILTKLAKNPDKMDKMMDYANKYYMYWDKVKNGTDDGPAFDIKFNIRSFNEL